MVPLNDEDRSCYQSQFYRVGEKAAPWGTSAIYKEKQVTLEKL
jgi:hypothetical protein